MYGPAVADISEFISPTTEICTESPGKSYVALWLRGEGCPSTLRSLQQSFCGPRVVFSLAEFDDFLSMKSSPQTMRKSMCRRPRRPPSRSGRALPRLPLRATQVVWPHHLGRLPHLHRGGGWAGHGVPGRHARDPALLCQDGQGRSWLHLPYVPDAKILELFHIQPWYACEFSMFALDGFVSV